MINKQINKSNKYIKFINDFTDIHGNKYPYGVKFRITSEDALYYYINDNKTTVAKSLEYKAYTIGEIIHGG